MQLVIKIAKAPLYFVAWCVLMMIMGFITVGVLWILEEVIYILAVGHV